MGFPLLFTLLLFLPFITFFFLIPPLPSLASPPLHPPSPVHFLNHSPLILLPFIFSCSFATFGLNNYLFLLYSRDKQSLNNVIDSDRLAVIVRLAGLVPEEEALQRLNQQINYDGRVSSVEVDQVKLLIKNQLPISCWLNKGSTC